MGLAVAQKLQNLGWNIATVDIHPESSTTEAEESQASSLYIRANVTIYEELLNAFRKTKEKFGSIDFVYANAGIIGKGDFYDVQELKAPTAPSLSVQEICLTGVIYTSHLAMHFMRQNEIPGGVIIMTASGTDMRMIPSSRALLTEKKRPRFTRRPIFRYTHPPNTVCSASCDQ